MARRTTWRDTAVYRYQQGRALAGRALRAAGLRHQWVTIADQPDNVEPLPDAPLFAIIPTWMEADVIGATVRNARTQGCERVLILDNDSPDETVAEAIAAGGELARSFSTPQLDEPLKTALLNQVVADVSAADGREHIWWMWLDADEFMHGPGGMTVCELVTSLDRRFRIVGSHYFDHLPDGAPESLPHFHPLDTQPLCVERRLPSCPARHGKHHLQRWDRSGPPITSIGGFHIARAQVTLLEPRIAAITHHFPYRLQAATRGRLGALCAPSEDGTARVAVHDRQAYRRHGSGSGMSERYRDLDAVYGDGDDVDLASVGYPANARAVMKPWSEQAEPGDVSSARWYQAADLESAIGEWRRTLLRSDATAPPECH